MAKAECKETVLQGPSSNRRIYSLEVWSSPLWLPSKFGLTAAIGKDLVTENTTMIASSRITETRTQSMRRTGRSNYVGVSWRTSQ
jgi:hypothetical protein